jgi:hypothetical protein
MRSNQSDCSLCSMSRQSLISQDIVHRLWCFGMDCLTLYSLQNGRFRSTCTTSLSESQQHEACRSLTRNYRFFAEDLIRPDGLHNLDLTLHDPSDEPQVATNLRETVNSPIDLSACRPLQFWIVSVETFILPFIDEVKRALQELSTPWLLLPHYPSGRRGCSIETTRQIRF